MTIHRDFLEHPHYDGLKRAVNVFIYLDGDLDSDSFGDLELWELGAFPRGGRCNKVIRVLQNRMVIFQSSQSSYHGHPWPLRVSANETRRSLAFYYYTKDAAIPRDSQLGKLDTLDVPHVCESRSDPKCYGDAVIV